MPQSLSRIILHIVFSTKDRKPTIYDGIAEQLFAYLGKCCVKNDAVPLIIGGYVDHVHIAILMNRTRGVACLVKNIKTDSSNWIRSQDQNFRQFLWQRGYGVFSVSESQYQKLARYIGNQKQHHQKIGFMEEYRLFLKKHGVVYDEHYLWD